MNDHPVFPLKVHRRHDSVVMLETPGQIEKRFGFIDTDDHLEGIRVVDAQGRRVRLKVVARMVETFELLLDDEQLPDDIPRPTW